VLEACGFDSIPAEMGLLHTKKQFDGMAYAVEAKLFKPPTEDKIFFRIKIIPQHYTKACKVMSAFFLCRSFSVNKGL